MEQTATGPTSWKTKWGRRVPWIVVLVIASVMALRTYQHFLVHERHLWTTGIHDRNAHYCFGLNLALDLRHGDVKELRHDLNGARVWGPLYGLILSNLLLIGGPDPSIAILPSLLGWVATVLLAFLIARRVVPQAGSVAGVLAAALVLVSPAHQGFAGDVMLESLGACLTLCVIYLYLVSVQDQAKWAMRGLPLALSALFFLKYNYWFLVLVAISFNEIVRRWSEVCPILRRWWTEQAWKKRATTELKNPLNYLILLLAAASIWIALTGGTVLKVGKAQISVRSPHNVVHVAYVLIFVRLLWWWRRGGAEQVRRLHFSDRQMTFCHAWPIAVWFLLPKRLGYFLWYLFAPHGEHVPKGFWEGANDYWHAFVTDYHLGLGIAVLVVALTVVTIVAHRRLRPGASVLLCFLLLCLVLTLQHPNRKSRFLHSWIAAGWILAGAGVAQLAYSRLFSFRGGKLRPWVAGIGTAGVLTMLAPGMSKIGTAPEGGVKPERGSLLDVSESYLPELERSKRVAILCNVPLKFFTEWTYLQKYGGTRNVVTHLRGYDPSRELGGPQLHQWLHSLKEDTLVLFQIPPGSYFYVPISPLDYSPLKRQLDQQKIFHLGQRVEFPKYGCWVEVWHREVEHRANRER